MAENTHCIVHGLPGRDPLTVEGPFADEAAAAAKAGLHAQVRPDVPAIVDVLVHPENVQIEYEGVFPRYLRGEIKHASYEYQPHLSARLGELLQSLEHQLESLESSLETYGLSVPTISAADRNRLWKETHKKDHTTGPLEEELRGHVQKLLLTGERLSRASAAIQALPTSVRKTVPE